MNLRCGGLIKQVELYASNHLSAAYWHACILYLIVMSVVYIALSSAHAVSFILPIDELMTTPAT